MMLHYLHAILKDVHFYHNESKGVTKINDLIIDRFQVK